ncbi:hypothetical protein [Roseivirga echinicomitans]|uniref:hypothetical protein n=1 Tax=Roseivirga echinicomitans TaxID=296218 RepID=UPI0012FD66A1|nr:hypothetical protein [Roseivirga echinicomitans]
MNFRNTKRFKKEVYLYESQSDSLRIKNSFLKSSFDYSLAVDKAILSKLPEEKDIIVYFSGGSCTSCVENLLIELKDIEGIQNRTLIISDSQDKDQFVIRFNDAFITNYSHRVDTTSYFEEDIYDVLVLKIRNKKITSLLVYRPEEKHFFKEYFFPLD